LVLNPKVFLLLNLALAFYNVGTIWAHEMDIFRSWKLLDPSNFHAVQRVHWRKLPYWVCAVTRRRFPVGASPTRQPLLPEATGAGMEETKCLKPSDSGSRIGDRASVRAATRVSAPETGRE
jgi:hypothetical protein